jgi:lactate permease
VRVAPVVINPPEAAMMIERLCHAWHRGLRRCLLAVPFLGMSFGRASRSLGRPFATPILLAISFMVGLAFVTRYSGMDTVLGLSLTRTGWVYPFFGTLLGWLGVALTGTDAGSNALFGNLQKVTAEQLTISPC